MSENGGKIPALRRRAWMLYAATSVLVLSLVCALVTWPTAERPATRTFDTVIDLSESTSGSVKFDRVVMCECWSGPYLQIMKKLKFMVTNDGVDSLDIAGGKDSSIYLFVAYRDSFKPVVKMPKVDGATTTGQLARGGVPANVDLQFTTGYEEVQPLALGDGIKGALGVSEGWEGWAIPANPNMLAWSDGRDRSAYPTYVEREVLRPSESYHSSGVGVGDWIFFMPVPPELEARYSGPFSIVNVAEDNKYMRILGVAAVEPSTLDWLGFAPAPPASAWGDGKSF